MVIREAVEQDYEAVNRMMRESQEEHAKALPHIFALVDNVVDPSWYASYMRNEKKRIFLAERPPHIVGYAMVEMKEAPKYDAFVPRRYALVNEIGVARHCQRQGIGTRLFRACAAWAASQGASSVELTVWEFNEKALRFYESLGMRTLNRTMSLDVGREGETPV